MGSAYSLSIVVSVVLVGGCVSQTDSVLVKSQKKPWASSSYLLMVMVGAARLVVGKISNNLAGGPLRPADRIIVYHTIRPLSAH